MDTELFAAICSHPTCILVIIKPILIQFSSVSKSDRILKVWTGNEANEYRSTEPFGDTVALESPPEGTQLENIDTELLVIPDSVDDMATQMLEDYKEEVVLDSDDEGVHETEMACSKELTSRELQRIVGGDVLDAPCARSEDFVVGSVASSHKNCTAGPHLLVQLVVFLFMFLK